MKNKIVLRSIQKITLLVSLVLMSHYTDAKNLIYLENQYGAEIYCKAFNNNKNNNHMLINNKETLIGRGVRVLLGVIPADVRLKNEWVNSVEIKTARYFSLSSDTSLDNYLDEIVRVFTACCTLKMNCRQDLCNKDAVIVIKPSSILFDWDISVRWETSGSITAFEMNQFR